MDIKKLHFFDKDGYNLNFEFNKTTNCWEGNIYLPPVSVGLYSNTTIFVLEEVEVPLKHDTYEKHWKTNEMESVYVFPRKDEQNSKITFQWDVLNEYIDEFFMFTFDENYRPTKYSSLQYGYNIGPDCETLIVNRFDTYDVILDDTKLTNRNSKRVLPIHVAFSSPEQYTANTFKRTLVMRSGFRDIARITFFAETIEEDERLKTWTYNLGYNIKPEDTIIFRNNDIEEPKPDFKLLNEKRKEILIEGHNIYPYVGSYKAILGAIKFFGYDNLNIIEFWRNINPNDPDFGKFVMSPKYVLSNKENTFIKDTPIDFPNSSYRKANKLAFTYTINTPTGEVDLYELPYVKEEFTFSMNEILLKLIALRKKLNSDFMPSSSKIIDIIGEASYFGIQLLKNNFSFNWLKKSKDPINLGIKCFPNHCVNITDDEFFNDFIFEKQGESKNTNLDSITIINNIKDKTLEEIGGQTPLMNKSNVNDLELSEPEKSELFKQYYKSLTTTFLKTEDVIDNDLYPIEENIPENMYSKTDDDYIDKLNTGISAKVILSNNTFKDKTFNDLPYSFKYIGNTFNNINTLDTFVYDWEKEFFEPDIDNKVYLKWTVTYSDDQLDEGKKDNRRKDYYKSLVDRVKRKKEMELENNHFLEYFIHKNKPTIRIEEDDEYMVDEITEQMKNFKAIKYGELDDMNNVLFELPWIGYYDVELTMYKHTASRSTSHNNACPCCGHLKCSCTKEEQFDHIGNLSPYVVENTKKFKKYIKVEPRDLDIRGFYYDSRPIPKHLDIKETLDETVVSKIEMEKDLLKSLNYLTYLAKNDEAKRKYKKNTPGGYDLQVVTNPRMNYTDEKKHIYDIHNGPYAKENFKYGQYVIQDGEFIVDNLNKEIVNLIPSLQTARYIRDGVDVKPYTWIYLTYDYSKIVHRSNPKWVLTNNKDGSVVEYDGKYFTYLLRHEGDYTISLTIYDIYGNKYSVERNIFVVDKNAKYNRYTSIKTDYESFKKLERYKEEVALEEQDRLDNHYYDEEYFFDFGKLKSCDYDTFLYDFKDFVKQLDRDKKGYNTGRDPNEITGRLSIEPGHGLVWDFDSPWDISYFDYFNLLLEISPSEDDELYIYFVQNIPNSYCEYRIVSSETIIPIEEILKDVDVNNISYIGFFNTGKKKIDFNIQNIGFEYNV